MFVCVSWERGIRRGSPEGRRWVRELYEALAWVGSKSRRLPVGLWTQGPSVRTASELAAHSSVHQAGEVHTLNADFCLPTSGGHLVCLTDPSNLP